MTTYLRTWLVAFVIGWLLSSVGYGQTQTGLFRRSPCKSGFCPAPRGVQVGVGVGPVAPLPEAAPRQLAQAPSPQFDPAPPPMMAPPMMAPAPSGPSSHTVIQHPPVVISVEPAPTIHVRAPQVIVQYQSGPTAPPQASFSPPQSMAAPPMPQKTLPSPQSIRTLRLESSVSITRPVYRSGSRFILQPTRQHLRWLD